MLRLNAKRQHPDVGRSSLSGLRHWRFLPGPSAVRTIRNRSRWRTSSSVSSPPALPSPSLKFSLFLSSRKDFDHDNTARKSDGCTTMPSFFSSCDDDALPAPSPPSLLQSGRCCNLLTSFTMMLSASSSISVTSTATRVELDSHLFAASDLFPTPSNMIRTVSKICCRSNAGRASSRSSCVDVSPFSTRSNEMAVEQSALAILLFFDHIDLFMRIGPLQPSMMSVAP
mmetsp:Transcript_14521/g.41174  ORF Transcript_14521/g.41174 Transcript_14521/m.41174 type:complete len:227 (-) Transcript_14521:231-911(-)